MRVKICGIRRREDALAAMAAGADMVGFIFVPGTPRALLAAEAGWIRGLAGVETVGVFRDQPQQEILEIRDLLRLTWVQLHGDEPEGWIKDLGPGVIRRLPVSGPGVSRAGAEEVLRRGARILVDPGGGDGRNCDWAEVGRRLAGMPFGLAGGLDPENVAAAISQARPEWVDVSSGVERKPGIKDLEKIRRFIEEAKSFQVEKSNGEGEAIANS